MEYDLMNNIFKKYNECIENCTYVNNKSNYKYIQNYCILICKKKFKKKNQVKNQVENQVENKS
jgi:hypothetical protein